MRSGSFNLAAGTALAIALMASPASAQKKCDTGASDTEIKIGQTVPFSGPASAELLVKILQQCGDDLTRENIMRQAANLKNVTGSLSLPGMITNTSPTDDRINKQMQMMKFNGERWELFGPIIEDAGPAG